jgi:Flp pilus assembly protein TadB
MSAITTYCPLCQRAMEIPSEFDNVVCPGCATAFWVRRHREIINLSEMWPDAGDSLRIRNAKALIESRLEELSGRIEEFEDEIEILRSREKSAPLQRGCAFFSLFMAVILVIVLFMLLGRGYFGSWLFFVAVAVVVLLSLYRIRQKIAGASQIETSKSDRLNAEQMLTQLRAEFERYQQLKQALREVEEPPDTP